MSFSKNRSRDRQSALSVVGRFANEPLTPSVPSIARDRDSQCPFESTQAVRIPTQKVFAGQVLCLLPNGVASRDALQAAEYSILCRGLHRQLETSRKTRAESLSASLLTRRFNFRARNAERRQHAAQYIAEPDYDYSRRRAKFPEEFEPAVDPSIAPTAWIHLRLVVHDGRVRLFVGQGNTLALDVRELRTAARGQVGLYVDNGSDGVFANVRIVHGS